MKEDTQMWSSQLTKELVIAELLRNEKPMAVITSEFQQFVSIIKASTNITAITQNWEPVLDKTNTHQVIELAATLICNDDESLFTDKWRKMVRIATRLQSLQQCLTVCLSENPLGVRLSAWDALTEHPEWIVQLSNLESATELDLLWHDLHPYIRVRLSQWSGLSLDSIQI